MKKGKYKKGRRWKRVVLFHFQAKYVFERRFTAKHLTMFGFFLTYSQSVRAKKKKRRKGKKKLWSSNTIPRWTIETWLPESYGKRPAETSLLSPRHRSCNNMPRHKLKLKLIHGLETYTGKCFRCWYSTPTSVSSGSIVVVTFAHVQSHPPQGGGTPP